MIDLNQQFDSDNDNHLKLLDELQGNILKSHRRKHSAGIFITLPTGRTESRKLMRAIARLLTEGKIISSARNQMDDSERWKNGRARDNPNAFGMVALSANAYHRLQLKDYGPAAAGPQQSVEHEAAKAFLGGMRKGEGGLYARWTPAPQAWEPFYRDHRADLLLLLAHDKQSELEKTVQRAESVLEGATFVIEKGRASAGKAGLDDPDAATEHFGFRDGISKPIFFKDKNPAEAYTSDYDPTATLNQILWPEKWPKEEGKTSTESFGSFLAVLKMEQNVMAFQTRAREMKALLGLARAEDAEALSVGRKKDGTPLTRVPAPENQDDFDFARDPLVNSGAKVCPASAHIRRMNGRRGPNVLPLARRSFHYGPSWQDEGQSPPAGGVGLMFMAMSSSLHSFTSLMATTESPRCPEEGGGVDALIGRTQPTTEANPSCDGRQRWWSARDRSWPHFRMTDFVTVRGGEYFFVPSVRFLKEMSSLAAVGRSEGPRRSATRRKQGSSRKRDAPTTADAKRVARKPSRKKSARKRSAKR